MEPWEDELLWDDDFSDEEEVAEEQIEETGLKMDEDSFADWEDASDGAPVDETLEEALAEERTLELESELEQDEHPRDYMPSWRTRRKKRRPPVRSGSSGKFAQRLCGGWRKQPGQNPTF